MVCKCAAGSRHTVLGSDAKKLFFGEKQVEKVIFPVAVFLVDVRKKVVVPQ